MNGLCHNDQYTVVVTFGTRREGRMEECAFQQPNVTQTLEQMFEEIDVPADIVPGDGEEYCYYAVLKDTQGQIIDGIPIIQKTILLLTIYIILFDR